MPNNVDEFRNMQKEQGTKTVHSGDSIYMKTKLSDAVKKLENWLFMEGMN